MPDIADGHVGESKAEIAPVGEGFSVRPFGARPAGGANPLPGSRNRVSGPDHGRYVHATRLREPLRRLGDLALDATLRAAALRRPDQGSQLTVLPVDYRRKVRESRIGNLILFLVDASGSMAARRRMVAVKGAIFSLLVDAYQKRDQVGLITFRNAGADLLLPPTNSVYQAQQLLQEMPAGGLTPLASGLRLAAQILHRRRFMSDKLSPLLVLLSDGRANVSLSDDSTRALEDAGRMATLLATMKLSALVVDCEIGFPRLGLARSLAEDLSARYLKLEELAAENLAHSVRGYLKGLQGGTRRRR